MENYSAKIDTSGMPCPLPIIKASKALKSMHNGEILKLVATDIGTMADIPSMCDQLNVELVIAEQIDDSYFYYIKK